MFVKSMLPRDKADGAYDDEYDGDDGDGDDGDGDDDDDYNVG